MIVPSGAVRVLVATRPVDFRKGMDGLAALVRESLGSDPYSGVIYVFRAKRADRVKLLLWDGTGLVLVAKRLEKSSFRWPRISVSDSPITLFRWLDFFVGLSANASRPRDYAARRSAERCAAQPQGMSSSRRDAGQRLTSFVSTSAK